MPGRRIAVPQPVQRPWHTHRLDQAQQVGVVTGCVHPGEARTGEDERLFEDPAQSFAGVEIDGERFEGKFGTQRSRSASHSALTDHVRNYSAYAAAAQPL